MLAASDILQIESIFRKVVREELHKAETAITCKSIAECARQLNITPKTARKRVGKSIIIVGDQYKIVK